MGGVLSGFRPQRSCIGGNWGESRGVKARAPVEEMYVVQSIATAFDMWLADARA